MKKNNWMGFTLQFFVISGLPLTVLLLVVAFGSQMLHHEAMRNLVGDRDLRTVQAVSGSIEQEMSLMENTIRILSRSMDKKNDFSSLIITPEEITATFAGGIVTYSADSNLNRSHSNKINWQDLPSQIPDTFIAILEDKSQPAFSPLIIPAGNSDPYLFVGILTDQKKMLVGAFSPNQLIENAIGSLVSAEEEYLGGGCAFKVKVGSI